VLYGNSIPISGRTDSREPNPYKEKKTLSGTPVDFSEFSCVAALDPEGPISLSGFGNINPIPFRSVSGTVPSSMCPASERISPIP
jgi:hypothetical protein